MYAKKKTKEERGYQVFRSELELGRIQTTVLMYGPENYLKDWGVSQLKKRFVSEFVEAIDFQIIDGSEKGADAILQAATTMPMMSEKRVTVVRDCPALVSAGAVKGYTQDQIDALIDYVQHPNEHGLLVFVNETVDGRGKLVKAIKKHGKDYNFVSFTDKEMRSFAIRQFKNAGVTITTQDLDLLIRETGYFNKESGYRLYNFENDLSKIIALSENGRVKTEDIIYAVAGDHNTFVFDLLDGISGNDKRSAYQILNSNLAEDKNRAFSLLGQLVSQMEVLYHVRELMDAGMRSNQISDYTGYHSYRIQKAMGYAGNYTKEKLRKMLIEAYDVNDKVTSGLMDVQLALEMFIASI